MGNQNSNILEYDGTKYPCTFCELIFLTSASLQLHIDISHRDQLAAEEPDVSDNARSSVMTRMNSIMYKGSNKNIDNQAREVTA